MSTLRLILTTTLLTFFCCLSQAQTEGMASYYANHFHGRRTSDGGIYNKNAYTCAHRTLPFGTILKVTNLKNNRTTVVKVTDRGPFSRNKLIDLSYAAAQDIGMIGSGVARVRIEKINVNDVDEVEHKHLEIAEPFKEDELTLNLKAELAIDTIWFLPLIPTHPQNQR